MSIIYLQIVITVMVAVIVYTYTSRRLRKMYEGAIAELVKEINSIDSQRKILETERNRLKKERLESRYRSINLRAR